jgi:hypothetical protein
LAASRLGFNNLLEYDIWKYPRLDALISGCYSQGHSQSYMSSDLLHVLKCYRVMVLWSTCMLAWHVNKGSSICASMFTFVRSIQRSTFSFWPSTERYQYLVSESLLPWSMNASWWSMTLATRISRPHRPGAREHARSGAPAACESISCCDSSYCGAAPCK